MERAYLVSARALSGFLVVVGLAMLATALARGGGPLSVGALFGLLLAALGAGRLWLSRGAAPGAEGR